MLGDSVLAGGLSIKKQSHTIWILLKHINVNKLASGLLTVFMERSTNYRLDHLDCIDDVDLFQRRCFHHTLTI